MDAYLGEIKLFAGNYAPQGWALCNGAIMQVNQNNGLFAVIGNQYGGDGHTTFGLPNLQGRVPVGYNPTGPSLYPMAATGGLETVVLNSTQMPSHTHGLMVDGNPAPTVVESSPVGNYLAVAQVDIGGVVPVSTYSTQLTPPAFMNPLAIASVGQNAAHENRMPYQVINYIICLSGIFPPRS